MRRYVVKRLISLLGTLLGVSVLIFLMVHLIPGDPATQILGQFATPEAISQMRTALGLDQPLWQQYVGFLGRLLTGDLGTSLFTGESVWEQIVTRFPITLQLAIFSVLIAAIFGILLGTIAAVKQNTLVDRFVVLLSLVGISAPGFWIALFLIWIFAYKLALFPISGYEGVHSLLLPAITLGMAEAGMIARMTRASMLEVIKQDYMRTAEAKGASLVSLIFSHGLPNAIIPVVTMIGLQFGSLMAGAVVVETVFSLQGIGSLAIEAISKRDMPTVQGMVFFMALIFALTNLIVDLIYSRIDPRIHFD
ncbi:MULTISPECIES: ABC transporter permease [Brevibacillus]|jgi:peptide/nickel transport system permease protein|uniref:Peptide ABC transporter permease n=1 Tax=Brevibacillus parabrevis TaxID=54914 RepID=A0A4Y3PI72_BREPA|nr:MULTISPECIES: ABC transporter permease [Brevibacillus]MBU8714320.1 ABC transporter permease [Brevibacillus parabrevis]MDH6351462.1 peptide/nickel transport system permease protein [Brevibacillus sp. 1238]MDR4998837.1 ABC transporter permease [Brevibacillus parabrevis]MED2254971.1 ABC transporter permease [Brevibacillus parabrevis]NRQ57084.1 ABC transporter permease [Brevibacillus sp. HD1.4A]